MAPVSRSLIQEGAQRDDVVERPRVMVPHTPPRIEDVKTLHTLDCDLQALHLTSAGQSALEGHGCIVHGELTSQCAGRNNTILRCVALRQLPTVRVCADS